MNFALRTLWAEYSRIKTRKLDNGLEMADLSGRMLNVFAGLPPDAEWRESNFDQEPPK